MTHRTQRVVLTIFALLILSSAALSACSPKAGAVDQMAMASMADMPEDVKSAPATVQQAYQFAAANPELMKQMPCYCGCGKIGHTSNYACYVQGVDEKGIITYDSHALGCSICVDITQDAMRLLKQGKNATEIKSYIDQTYAQYGPSNIP